MDGVSLRGKTVIVTGANGGIGRETAKQLARRGARVILACRDATKAEEARRQIVESTQQQQWQQQWQQQQQQQQPQSDDCDVVVRRLDLASLTSVREFAADISQNEPRVDILVNNAGVIVSERRLTEDGYESHFAVNHLGHFLLTYLLLPKLASSRPSRVVTVSSVAHRFYDLDFDDLQTTNKWNVFKAYGRSKTANVLFTSYLALLLKDRGVTSYCLHPGLVGTDLGRELEGSVAAKCFRVLWACLRVRLLTPEEGARTTLYCCLEPSIANRSGHYYSECKETRAKTFARNAASAEKLWQVSCRMCQLPADPFALTPAAAPVVQALSVADATVEKSNLRSVNVNNAGC